MPENWQQQAQIGPRARWREFHGIAEDSSHPCEIFREAIRHAFQARANHIEIDLSVLKGGPRDILRIEIAHDGIGMTRQELQKFFGLENSASRGDRTAVGDKELGAKLLYRSSHLEVITVREGVQLQGEAQVTYGCHASDIEPKVVVLDGNGAANGTRITINDYNCSLRDRFTQKYLRDYVLWFTKFGSVEREFGINDNEGVRLTLKGVDSQTKETLTFGHVFPGESGKLDKLLDQHRHDAPKVFVKKWTAKGALKEFPDIKWEAVFYLEGDSAKRQVNPMIREEGGALQNGTYTVQERYGLWLCKDYIPVQRMNEWITETGSDFTRFHAFINCQDFRLSANRNSVMSTPPQVLEQIRQAATEFFRKRIIGSLEYADLDWLVGQVAEYVGQECTERDCERRSPPALEPPRTTLGPSWGGERLGFSAAVEALASLLASATHHIEDALKATERVRAKLVALVQCTAAESHLPPAWAKMMLRRRSLVCAALALAVLSTGLFFVSRRDSSVPSQLHLETYDRNGELHIRWNPSAEVVRSAIDASLLITDGDERLTVMLDAGQLKRGAAVYARRTGRIQLSMTLKQAQGRELIATTGFYGGQPRTFEPIESTARGSVSASVTQPPGNVLRSRGRPRKAALQGPVGVTKPALKSENEPQQAQIHTGANLPFTCSPGDVFRKTDAPAGWDTFRCGSKKVWSMATPGIPEERVTSR